MTSRDYIWILVIALLAFTAEGQVEVLPPNNCSFKTETPSNGEVVDPLTLVKNFVVGLDLYTEPFVQLQLKLEHLGDEANLYNLTEEERNNTIQMLLQKPEVEQIIEECKKFHKTPDCNSDIYRSVNGTCNNLKYPNWGSTNMRYQRILPASYEGISGIRKAAIGKDLPTPRSIALQMKHTSNPSTYVSALFTFFGQAVVHDLTLSPETSVNGFPPDCCNPSGTNNSLCIPIYVEEDDAFYSQFNVTCLNSVRTGAYPTCKFGKRIQLNIKTAFVDASNIYGVNETETNLLRAKDGTGRLKSQETMYGEILPKNENSETLFCLKNETENCFASGDDRTNQNSMLTSWQTIFFRLHNLFADTLSQVNSQWPEEKLFQEARRLVGATLQYIIYNEYLPKLVGPQYMLNYNLSIDFGLGTFYDDEVDPNIISEFNTAAFRLHSMVPKIISDFPSFKMVASYTNVCPIHHGFTGPLVIGSGEVPSQQNDRFIMDDVSDFLYKPPGASYGFDLASVNIQRGRDHGMPPYIDIVSNCSDGQIAIRSFSDLKQTMTLENIKLLENMYRHVSDIDMWLGLIMETAVEGGVVGRTSACILSQQFNKLKFGDSFFFTHKNGRYPFSVEQLNTIKYYTMSRVICETTNVTQVRKDPQLLPGVNNPFVSCQSLPKINLGAWRDKSTYTT